MRTRDIEIKEFLFEEVAEAVSEYLDKQYPELTSLGLDFLIGTSYGEFYIESGYKDFTIKHDEPYKIAKEALGLGGAWGMSHERRRDGLKDDLVFIFTKEEPEL